MLFAETLRTCVICRRLASSIHDTFSTCATDLGERSTCHTELLQNARAAASLPSSLHVSLWRELHEWTNQQISLENTTEAAVTVMATCAESFRRYLNPDSHKVERYSRSFDKPNHGTLLEGSRGKMLRVHEE